MLYLWNKKHCTTSHTVKKQWGIIKQHWKQAGGGWVGWGEGSSFQKGNKLPGLKNGRLWWLNTKSTKPSVSIACDSGLTCLAEQTRTSWHNSDSKQTSWHISQDKTGLLNTFHRGKNRASLHIWQNKPWLLNTFDRTKHDFLTHSTEQNMTLRSIILWREWAATQALFQIIHLQWRDKVIYLTENKKFSKLFSCNAHLTTFITGVCMINSFNTKGCLHTTKLNNQSQGVKPATA